ncbi:MAG TPA: PilT/PilU family type 4a pilus ATPase [Phycisphaerae bacterium]|nr:PilT/PilU family type 4a pilus ATPase [Phycisphaerae bacterium]
MLEQSATREIGDSRVLGSVADHSDNGDMQREAISAELLKLLHTAAEREAADIHLVADYPPVLRVHGNLEEISDEPFDADELERMLWSIVPERFQPRFARRKSFDSSVAITHDGSPYRFRANVYLTHGSWAACLRHIPNKIPNFGWLGFPQELADRLVSHPNGLIILTGVTGSGKTASLAAIIDHLRKRGGYHILTVEEPVEYVHEPGGGSLVTQREVGRDVDSFAEGLKYGLRQDPNVILVGEIRDGETAQMAISAAETGHLIFTTLHTRDAKGALTRLVDLFPYESQEDIRKQLAMSLRAVVAQHLLPSAVQGEKRVLALEVLHCTQQVQAAIRQGKIESLDSAIQTGKRGGMLTLDEDLQRLVQLGKLTVETARRYAKDPTTITPPTTTQEW